MFLEQFLFYGFSFAICFLGLLVIASRNPVNSAIFLVLVLFFVAGLFVLLGAFFLAAVQILIYAGAIMVLFLFVIMFLNVAEEEKRKWHWFGAVGSILIPIALLAEFIVILRRSRLISAPTGLVGTTEAIGKLLFSKYLLPFEVTSLILLVAIVGVIVLSKKESKP